MSMENDGTLSTEAQIIRDETSPGENTASRIGIHMLNMIASKVNWTQVDPEVTLAGNSDQRVASQKAIKAYIAAIIGGGVTTVKVAVSDSEILQLFTTPKVLVAAPGAGKFISILNICFFMNSGSNVYGTQTELRFSNGAQIYNTSTSPLSNTASNTKYFNIGDLGAYTINNASNVDTALYVSVPTANPTGGNGNLAIYITYKVIDV